MPAVITSRTLPSVLSLLLLLSLFSAATSDELQLLLSIKTAFQSSNTSLFHSWNSDNSVCNFTGITCNSENSVQAIELLSSYITGEIPFDSICQLKSLEKLSLGRNSLSGRVTDDLKNCVRLKHLDLSGNLFSGTVPDISSLNELTVLYLNQSGFSGTFPWNSLSNMTNMILLSLGDNKFDPTPFPNVVTSLVKLNWLYLTNCSIEGKIPPEIGNLTELINLELSTNSISGEIPPEIVKLNKLWQLELYENYLTGKIPVGFRNLTRLEYFDASINKIEGDLSELRFSNQLVSLQLLENELSGEIPEEFGEFKKLLNLSMYRNKLTGPLPQKLGSWSEFCFIDLSENSLTGQIPPDMCKLGKMNELLLLQNRFTGEIPASYASCSSLERFRVSDNLLSGVVPAGIWGLPNLNYIDIASNQFEGEITSNIKNARSLGRITVSKNRLTGELPAEISNASLLVSIDLSYNKFSGELPVTIWELGHLGNFHIQHNMFTGEIPESIGSCESLNDVNMGYNLFSGQIPVTLGSLPALNALNLSSNQLSGQIPGSFSSLKLSLFDVSNNKLTGSVPESLSILADRGSFAGNNGLCSQKSKYFRPCVADAGKSHDLHTLIACFAVGSAVIIFSLGFFIYIKKIQQKDDQQEKSLKQDSWSVKSFHHLSFTEDEILDSINRDNLIGKGGSGNVYKVSTQQGVDLAVKHIWNSDSGDRKVTRSTSPMLSNCTQKSSREFDAEVRTLSSIRHINVVKLYCSITSEDSSLLVYEYMPNGSLWDNLHTCRKMNLDWETRYEIALGSARGLAYLHHGLEKPVIHRDVKSSNILLDEFLKPRIADFGLAKIMQANDTSKDISHVIAGTHGYIAPEYGYTHKVNEKSDVYSFGVVLMELVAGKRPIEAEYGENKDIVSWVSNNLKNKMTILDIVDSSIDEPYKEEAIKVLKIAIMCTARLPTLRPTMRTVVQMLEDAEPCKLVSITISKKDDLGFTEKI
jgi:Leucine-rich repeat (LRR) protein